MGNGAREGGRESNGFPATRGFLVRRLAPTFVVTALGALSLLNAATLDVSRTQSPPVIDGVLSPGEWEGAAHSDVFRQVRPLEDVEPSERTEIWVTFDADNLYVAIRAHESTGRAGIRAFSMKRDQSDRADDTLRIVLDPFNRQNDGYHFALNAVGARTDGLIQNKDNFSNNWDGLWQGKVSQDEGGWSAEFAIPAKTISFNPANGTWGFNVSRSIGRNQESIRWSGFLRRKNSTSLPHAGTLTGVIGLDQGVGVDFKPFASFTTRSDPAPGEEENEFRAGFDLVWHVTPSFAAAFTVNTDFADAEVDERQVNLGRFPLFFPEKRGFFLQDASLFTFAGIGRNPLPFHSRRIGRAADGSKVDLLGGVKLTGRIGKFSIGVLDVQTDEHLGLESKNLFVGRVAMDVLEESTAGIIVTNGDPRFNGENTLIGGDFNYENNRLFDGKSLSVRASSQHTDSDQRGDTGNASALTVFFPNEPFAFFAKAVRISENYDPAMGFVERRGIQEFFAEGSWKWFPEKNGIRSVEVITGGVHVTDLRGSRLDTERWIDFALSSTSGDEIVFFVFRESERLGEPFDIRPNVIIPAGDHAWTMAGFELETSSSRPLGGELKFVRGEFFTGHRTDVEIEVNWRPSVHLQFSTRFAWNLVRLPEGDFDLTVNSTKVIVMINPDLEIGLIAQYDSFSRELGANFRVRWTVRPGSDVYLVVNQGYDTSLSRIRPTDNETSLKGGWTYRF